MPIYLTRDQLEMALRARRAVEQWLGVRDERGRRVIRWLRIEPTRADTFTVWLSEVFDTGNEHFFDLGEFEPVDPEQPEGASKTLPDWEAALAHADALGAKRDNFLPNGRIQDFYREFAFESKDWPFDEPENLAVITTRQVLEEGRPILLVTHDEDDGGWQFLCTLTNDPSDARVVSLKSVLDRDPSIAQIAKLPVGWRASRREKGFAWETGVNTSTDSG